MRTIQKLALRGTAFAVAATIYPAWALATPCAAPDEAAGGVSNAHTRYVETHLQPAVIKHGDKPFSLADRMRQYGVPGLTVAVIHKGKLDWARGWGVRDIASCAPVTPDTAFQAASISKVVTAVLALRLVEQGTIGLDSNINDALRSWKLPRDPKLVPDGVTLRELLSHTAGLGVHGFTGYLPGEPLPTTVQILDGVPPSKSGAVRSILPAGAQFEYSGGGYVVAQLALSDASKTPFPELAQREVLGPLDMTRSAFAHRRRQPFARTWPSATRTAHWCRAMSRWTPNSRPRVSGPPPSISPGWCSTCRRPPRGRRATDFRPAWLGR